MGHQAAKHSPALQCLVLTDRYWSKVNRTETCWYWTAVVNNSGYGKFWLDGRMVYAHRVAYEAKYGALPEGMELDHLCRRPSCVNPAHLEAVTQAENRRRAAPYRIACVTCGIGCSHDHLIHRRKGQRALIYCSTACVPLLPGKETNDPDC